jgi:hypothetical protein
LFFQLARRNSGQIVISLNLDKTRPASESFDTQKAAGIAEIKNSILYMDPLFGRGYPSCRFKYP